MTDETVEPCENCRGTGKVGSSAYRNGYCQVCSGSGKSRTTTPVDAGLVERVYDALPKQGLTQDPYYSLSAIRLILATAASVETIVSTPVNAGLVERLKSALTDIAMAQRLGTQTDLLSWQSLAVACQDRARAALEAIVTTPVEHHK